jgi:hypothetical protein
MSSTNCSGAGITESSTPKIKAIGCSETLDSLPLLHGVTTQVIALCVVPGMVTEFRGHPYTQTYVDML